MRHGKRTGALWPCVAALAVGGCAGETRHGAPPRLEVAAAARPCATAQASIHFDFDGASASRCAIKGPRSFDLLIAPEHAPPINPSPWYAFRYSSRPGGPVSVTLRYIGARHRYSPKLTTAGSTIAIAARLGEGGSSATLSLPPGDGIVSAQPLVVGASYAAFLDKLVTDYGARRVDLGKSLDGRPIEAVRLGNAEAPRLLVLLGRQHPPEVSGSYAMEPFVTALAAMLRDDPALAARYQILAVPLLNPDGVALGHWRANRGGVDINRDWGDFSQPETRAVRDFLDRLPASVKPVLMIDFHSTARNLFYVQGEEASAAQRRFLAAWLEGKEAKYPGYAFTIEHRDANPGQGTSKNWFHATYGIPAFTYEVGDDTGRAATAEAATDLAKALFPALDL